MTIQQLIDRLEELKRRNGWIEVEDWEVVAPLMDGMNGNCIRLNYVSKGGDWYNNKICLSFDKGLISKNEDNK